MKTPPTPSLHDRILSLEGVSPSLGKFPPPRTYQSIYMAGHKSALSATAALASEADAQIRELTNALQLLWTEVQLSGNAGSTDYGWPEAEKATLSALARATGTDTGK